MFFWIAPNGGGLDVWPGCGFLLDPSINSVHRTAKKFYEKHDKKEKPDTDSRNPKAKSAVKTGSESAKPKGGAKRSKAKSS